MRAALRAAGNVLRLELGRALVQLREALGLIVAAGHVVTRLNKCLLLILNSFQPEKLRYQKVNSIDPVTYTFCNIAPNSASVISVRA